MYTIKFLHLADTHLGTRNGKMKSINGRNLHTLDAENAFNRAITLAIEEEVDFVIHSGDMFDHVQVNRYEVQRAIHNLRKLTKKGIPFYVIAGNHDRSRRFRHSPLDELSSLSNVFVMKDPMSKTLKVGDIEIAIHCLPYQTQMSLDDIKEIQEKMLEHRKYYNILVMHQSVIGMNLGFDIKKSDDPYINIDDISAGFDYIALGHIHIRQEMNLPSNPNTLIHYPSSPFIVSFSERNMEKGYSLVEINTKSSKITTIPIQPRKFEELILHFDNPNGDEMVRILKHILDQYEDEDLYLGIRISGKLKESVKELIIEDKFEHSLAGLSFYLGNIYWISSTTNQLIST